LSDLNEVIAAVLRQALWFFLQWRGRNVVFESCWASLKVGLDVGKARRLYIHEGSEKEKLRYCLTEGREKIKEEEISPIWSKKGKRSNGTL
jgi:hypothetical protein